MMKGWAIMVEKNFSRGKKALSLRLETFFQRSENRGRKDARAHMDSFVEREFGKYLPDACLYNK